MTKQEEIREGLDKIIYQNVYAACAEFGGEADAETKEEVNEILNYLHSQGVVIKSDKPLPKPILGRNMSERDKEYKAAIWEYSQGAMLDAATEPLVKEG